MLNPLITTVREGIRYKGKAQQWMWVAHRVSGLGMLFFLILHVFGMSAASFRPEVHEAMLETYKTPLFSLLELPLAACLIPEKLARFYARDGARLDDARLRRERDGEHLDTAAERKIRPPLRQSFDGVVLGAHPHARQFALRRRR